MMLPNMRSVADVYLNIDVPCTVVQYIAVNLICLSEKKDKVK